MKTVAIGLLAALLAGCGQDSSGALHDCEGDGFGSWQETPPSGGIAIEDGVAVWSGSELLVWGGRSFDCAACKHGSAFDPLTRGWRPLGEGGAPSARSFAVAAWTGDRMLVWGGEGLILSGGAVVMVGHNDGALYDPVGGAWEPLVDSARPYGRARHHSIWTGSELIIWGGVTENDTVPLRDGARLDLATGVWRALPAEASPEADMDGSAVWTGSELIVWGGTVLAATGPTIVGTGAAYDPAADRWRAISTEGAPPARRSHSASWTGSEMIVFGGTAGGEAFDDGAAYDPTADSWRALERDGGPTPRTGHVAAWTGQHLLIWGGSAGCLAGAAYRPEQGSWEAMAGEGAPLLGVRAMSVWTGAELIVYGGGSDIGGVFRP